MIEIKCSDCLDYIKSLNNRNIKINTVMTSPPYNNSRTSHTDYCMKTNNCRYGEYDDNKTNEEYIKWTCDIFNNIDNILSSNGVICYNISYGNENPNVMWETISAIIQQTNFMVAETIVWKKQSAFPNNVSHNHLTRLFEFVFVFCRKAEYETFHTNKKVVSKSNVGQKFYENIFNYIEAKNNDGPCDLNKATYSTELCEKILNIYCPKSGVVLDPFSGTGTTAVACRNMGLDFYGSELSQQQVDYSLNRLSVDTSTNSNKVQIKQTNLW